MELMIRPNPNSFEKADNLIKILDQTSGFLDNKAPMVSKLSKQIKQVKNPVPRFFESPNQLNSYWAEGEFDLTAIFKLLGHESYFEKSVEKKVSQLIKSGFEVHSDDDQIKEYFQNRFLTMFLQTGVSLDKIVKTLAFYIVTCSNAFLIKVRDPKCTFATSYKLDNKEMQPIVGLFLTHPTQMKPRFKWVTFSSNGQKKSKLILEKWVHVNRRGVMVEFDPEDVAHFTLHKQDGLIFGTPEVIPVIDDIRTLRKMEEDIQLLVYRDLFPILHYSIEDPTVLDHQSGRTEIDQAKHDLERIMQDGGIATDKRHEIKYIGSQGKHMEIKPYLEYFQARVFAGLGVSAADMGMGQDISGNTANTMSKSMIDAVRYIQQELAAQFEELILTEMALQSPFGIDALRPQAKVSLRFEEIDIEWKIRKENHEADLFNKGVKTIDEVRNPMGHQTLDDAQFERTYHGMYEKPQLEADQELAHKQLKVQAATKATQLRAKAAKKTSSSPSKRRTQTSSKSAADRDSIKSSKSNSNIVKSHRDQLLLEDAAESLSIQDEFKSLIESHLKRDSKVDKRFNIILATKSVYDRIKCDMADKVLEGMYDAAMDLGIDPTPSKIAHNIYAKLDELRDSVTNMIDGDEAKINRAAFRVATAARTEKTRAYNYGYSLVAVNNNKTDFVIYSDASDIAEDSIEFLGKEVTITKSNILSEIPPFRPNSRLKIKLKESINGEANETTGE